MSSYYETASSTYTSLLEKLNLMFTSIFIAEMFIKIIALGPKAYFYYK